MDFRKKKKVLVRRKRKFDGLKLTLEDNKGKITTYFVSCRKPIMTIKKTHSTLVAHKLNRRVFWQIEDESININAPEKLIDKKIVLKKGNLRVVGKVRKVSPLYKSPEGEPVPVPPPPRT